tara:strand:- start:20 stop:955 length:936 start_codon:yes stop_codon:yes gene_type:complete
MFIFSRVSSFVNKIFKNVDTYFVDIDKESSLSVVELSSCACEEQEERENLAEVDVFNCLVQGYHELVKKGVLTNRNEEAHGVCGNHFAAIESAAFLANRLIKIDGWENHPLHTTPGRVLICACLTLAIKNTLDFSAFPSLNDTGYWNVQLAVVYHVIFQNLLTKWDNVESSSYYLECALERAEGKVLTVAFRRFDLFKLLNATPTLELEAKLILLIKFDEFNESKFDVVFIRNRCNEIVLNILCSDSTEMRKIVLENNYELTRPLAVASLAGTKLTDNTQFHKWLSEASNFELELSEKFQRFSRLFDTASA